MTRHRCRTIQGSAITRPANTTTYTAGDSFAGVTPAWGTFDLSLFRQSGCEITRAYLHLTNNPATTLSATLLLWSSLDALPAAPDADNAAVTYGSAAHLADFQACISPMATRIILHPGAGALGTNLYIPALTTQPFVVHPDPETGLLYYGIIVNNAYVPVSAEVLTPFLKCKFIG